MWDALSAYALASPGTLVIPVSERSTKGSDEAAGGAADGAAGGEGGVRGCDVLSDFHRIAHWVVTNEATVGRRIVLGTYIYILFIYILFIYISYLYIYPIYV